MGTAPGCTQRFSDQEIQFNLATDSDRVIVGILSYSSLQIVDLKLGQFMAKLSSGRDRGVEAA